MFFLSIAIISVVATGDAAPLWNGGYSSDTKLSNTMMPHYKCYPNCATVSTFAGLGRRGAWRSNGETRINTALISDDKHGYQRKQYDPNLRELAQNVYRLKPGFDSLRDRDVETYRSFIRRKLLPLERTEEAQYEIPVATSGALDTSYPSQQRYHTYNGLGLNTYPRADDVTYKRQVRQRTSNPYAARSLSRAARENNFEDDIGSVQYSDFDSLPSVRIPVKRMSVSDAGYGSRVSAAWNMARGVLAGDVFSSSGPGK